MTGQEYKYQIYTYDVEKKAMGDIVSKYGREGWRLKHVTQVEGSKHSYVFEKPVEG